MQVKISISQEDRKRITKSFIDLSDLKKRNLLNKFLGKSAAVIVKEARLAAETLNQRKKTFIIRRKGILYTIKPRTVKKSIGVMTMRKSSVPVVVVGYRAKSPYDGWFAQYLENGTNERKTKTGISRGAIEGRPIISKGEAKLPQAKEIFLQQIEKELLMRWK